ncbi:4Fe-4S binding protein [Azospirillum sp.]|uniref:4Fe-4S binding protein n=1 Tax=Azospirillum sp. TaxID=34012 RepID=UPI003D75C4EA
MPLDFGPPPRARIATAIEAFFVQHRDRLIYVHAAMFVAFLALIVGPLAVGDASAFHVGPFANYVLWGLWFPLVLLSVIVTGRSWCGLLCPMGAAAEWGNRIGPQRPVPAWMRWEGMPIASFVVVTILGQTVGVRTHAEAAAQIFGGTMLLAIVVGFVYGRRRRAWCRHLCPIGLLLGIFSRLGAVEFRPVVRLPGGDAYTDKGVCPMMIDLPRKEESRHCIECFRCVNPGAKGGMTVVLRRPGAEVERIRNHHANPVEVWFLFLGTGIALGGFLWGILPLWQDLRAMAGEWAIGQGWYGVVRPGPGWLMSVHPERREVYLWLDFAMISGFMVAVMLATAAALSATTAAAAALAGRGGAGDGGFRQRFTELAYQYAPVAMVSLVVGLGGKLFIPLQLLAGAPAVGAAKGGLFLLGLVWSLWLGDRILRQQGVRPGLPRLLPLAPGALGSLVVAAGWWPAIFGL